MKKILLIFNTNMFLKNTGVSVRFYEICKYLKSKDCIIDQWFYINDFPDWGTEETTKSRIINIKKESDIIRNFYYYDFNEAGEELKNLKETAFKQTQLYDKTFPKSKQKFKEIVKENKYDTIIICDVQFINFLDVIDKTEINIILMLEDFMSSNIYERNKSKSFDVFIKCFKKEISLINKAKSVVAISLDEILFLSKFTNETIKWNHLPHMIKPKNIVEKTKYENDILCISSNNKFNLFGICWFFFNEYKMLSDYKFLFVGNCIDYIQAETEYNIKKVKFKRYVKNLDDVYNNSKIIIAPIDGGTGLKIKIIEALSYGKPIVTNLQGLQGQPKKYNNGIIATDDPVKFANEIKRLLTDEKYYKQKQQEAITYFNECFNFNNFKHKLKEAFEL